VKQIPFRPSTQLFLLLMLAFCSLDTIPAGHILISYKLSFKATQDSKLKAGTGHLSMPCQLLSTSLSKAESEARRFYDRWIAGAGLLSILGRLIFRMSGIVYSGTFIRAAHLTPDQSILEIGCGMGTILTATRRRLASTSTYLGIDLSFQMIAQGRPRALGNRRQNSVALAVGSGLYLPVDDSLFDVVLLSHVIKYLTDEELSQVLWEARRALKPAGRVVLWEFHPVWNPSATQLILRCCKAQKLRDPIELKGAMKAAGFRDLTSFRVVTPWLPWSNVAFTGCSDGLPW
jgi:ubiquinone/menaquinone biosynthesis C-methylase UbiE